MELYRCLYGGLGLMNINITSGERIMLIVAVEESIKLNASNPNNFGKGLVDMCDNGLKNLKRKIEEGL